MRSVERRIEKIENKLHIGDKRTGAFIVLTSDRTKVLPEPVEEWITYKEAKVRCGQVSIFRADPTAELKARETTKSSKGARQ